jgi:cytochrome c556
MRKLAIFFVFHFVLLGSVSADDELTGDLMRTIEELARNLDSDVAQKEDKAATAEARELEEHFKQVEAYFARRGNAADAVAFSRTTQGFAAQVAQSVETGDHEAASSAVSSLVQSCKTCHQVYRK